MFSNLSIICYPFFSVSINDICYYTLNQFNSCVNKSLNCHAYKKVEYKIVLEAINTIQCMFVCPSMNVAICFKLRCQKSFSIRKFTLNIEGITDIFSLTYYIVISYFDGKVERIFMQQEIQLPLKIIKVGIDKGMMKCTEGVVTKRCKTPCLLSHKIFM